MGSAPARGGRPRDDAWSLVDVDEDNCVWCLRCGKLVHTQGKNHVARVRSHVNEKCAKRPAQPKITDSFKPKLQPDALKAFQESFAKWVYSTGMAFYKVEHEALLKALQLLNPGVQLPTYFQLSTTFLDRTYTKSLVWMQVELDGQTVTIVTDGWTDINGLSVINYVAVVGRKTFFLESVYTGSQGHDAQFLSADIKRVVLKYDFLSVGAVVTDNTATNKAAWELLQQEFPRLFFHGCAYHALHLLVKDTVGKVTWLETLLVSCKLIVTFFKTNHKLWSKLRSKLKSLKLRMLAMPGDTRWGSILSCLTSVLKAEEVLFAMVSERNFLVAKSKKKHQTRRMVFNTVTATDFVPKLKRATALLNVFGEPLKRFEENVTPVSEVYQLFLDLPNDVEKCGLPAKDVKVIKKLISDRFDFVYGDAHGVGHLLDPRYRGAGMDADTRRNVEPFLIQWHGDGGIDEETADAVVIELVTFHRFASELATKSTRTWTLLDKRKLTVHDFWCSLSQFPLLQAVAKQVFRCTAGSSASERNFSAHGFIHSKLRNRLAPDRVEKLVHIYFNAKNIHDEDIEVYTELDDILRLVDLDEDKTSDNRDADFVYE